jgi:site-specific recombinase XerC
MRRRLRRFARPCVRPPSRSFSIKASRRTKNLRAVQILLGHTKLESTVRYLGIEVNDALEMAEQTEV